MVIVKLYLQVAVILCLFITFSEQCNLGPNLGLGNIGIGNVGVGNMGVGNKGVFNKGYRNIGAFNRKSSNTIGVGNFFQDSRMGVASVLTVPNPFLEKKYAQNTIEPK